MLKVARRSSRHLLHSSVLLRHVAPNGDLSGQDTTSPSHASHKLLKHRGWSPPMIRGDEDGVDVGVA